MEQNYGCICLKFYNNAKQCKPFSWEFCESFNVINKIWSIPDLSRTLHFYTYRYKTAIVILIRFHPISLIILAIVH